MPLSIYCTYSYGDNHSKTDLSHRIHFTARHGPETIVHPWIHTGHLTLRSTRSDELSSGLLHCTSGHCTFGIVVFLDFPFPSLFWSCLGEEVRELTPASLPMFAYQKINLRKWLGTWSEACSHPAFAHPGWHSFRNTGVQRKCIMTALSKGCRTTVYQGSILMSIFKYCLSLDKILTSRLGVVCQQPQNK